MHLAVSVPEYLFAGVGLAILGLGIIATRKKKKKEVLTHGDGLGIATGGVILSSHDDSGSSDAGDAGEDGGGGDGGGGDGGGGGSD